MSEMTSPAACPGLTERVLVRFRRDCGRMGEVEGLFVTTRKTLEAAYGIEVCFGEILGKHSDIYGTLAPSDFTLVCDDQPFIDQLVSYVGEDISGHNPLKRLSDA